MYLITFINLVFSIKNKMLLNLEFIFFSPLKESPIVRIMIYVASYNSPLIVSHRYSE